MLIALANDKIEVSVRPPLAYLDHCAIRRISSTPDLREHLVETFKDRGTLMFSILNVVEMARNTGESYGQIRDLLDALGSSPCAWEAEWAPPRSLKRSDG